MLLATIAGLPDTALDKKGVVGDWSIKNVLAHLTDWERIVVQMLPERIAKGATPEILSTISADEDAFNAQGIARSEHLTPQEQLSQFAQSRQALFQLARDLGEETLQRRHPWPEWEGSIDEYILASIGEHEREHRDEIATAVTRLKAAGEV